MENIKLKLPNLTEVEIGSATPSEIRDIANMGSVRGASLHSFIGSEAEHRVYTGLAKANQTIDCIILIRAIRDLSLRDAKDYFYSQYRCYAPATR